MDSPLVVATFNLHAGVDGYGRRFDVVEACRAIGADVLLLQEVFAPVGGASQAEEVAAALNLSHLDLPLSRAWRVRQPAPVPPGAGWEPRRPYPRARRALRVGSYTSAPGPSPEHYEEGTWGVAVLSLRPIIDSEALELGRLRRDYTSRAALSVTLEGGLKVISTHMAHSTHGSPTQWRTLYRALPRRDIPAVLGGDMNFWGPPIEMVMRGWRRAAKGKTWPAWRPHHQLDHLFVTRALTSLGGESVRAGCSDHLPLRATIVAP
jgi:endonuclease/exonuclease/phosphatase family metal-dependent hydrolase